MLIGEESDDAGASDEAGEAPELDAAAETAGAAALVAVEGDVGVGLDAVALDPLLEEHAVPARAVNAQIQTRCFLGFMRYPFIESGWV
jgi:hypothetical protein